MSKRALVVEDDANIAELLRLYLGRDGFEVMLVSDGARAEKSFDLFTPDLVLLDIMLPGKDGWQICRDLRKKSAVPIIMLTAKGETADKVSGLEMGADDYVTKPFEVKELLARIHAVMRRSDGEGPVEKKLTFDKLVINGLVAKLVLDEHRGSRIEAVREELVDERRLSRTEKTGDYMNACIVSVHDEASSLASSHLQMILLLNDQCHVIYRVPRILAVMIGAYRFGDILRDWQSAYVHARNLTQT